MKSQLSLVGALAGAVGIGYNLGGNSDAWWLGFFIFMTTVNTVFLVWANWNLKESLADEPIQGEKHP
jgi:hypothetical protein